MTFERRFTEAMPLSVGDGTNSRRITGYAVVWNARSSDLGGFVETFAPHAFRDFFSSGKADVRGFVNHDTAKIIGRQSANTIRLYEDDKGVRFEIDVAETSYGDDLLESVRRGDITGMSFGFRLAKNGAKYDRSGGAVLRTVTAAEMNEISPVTFPAYEASSVLNRCAPEIAEELKAFQPKQVGNIDIRTLQCRWMLTFGKED